MLIRKAHKFRLKPSEEQSQKMHAIAGHGRFLWNKILAINLERLDNKQKLMWYHEADHWSKLWESSIEYGFLKEAPAHCLQQKLKDLNKAFKDGFNKKQPLKRLPRFKKRGMGDGFRFPEPKQIQIDNRRIKLPKIGWLRFYKSCRIDGVLKNTTVSRHAGRWYISLQVEMEIDVLKHPAGSAIGIDLGIKKFIAKSDGSYEDPINAYRTMEVNLAKQQRRLSKKKKFSENWKKQRINIQKIHSKITQIRRDYQHQLSTKLSQNHAMIVVENLQVKNMSKSSKGTREAPAAT